MTEDELVIHYKSIVCGIARHYESRNSLLDFEDNCQLGYIGLLNGFRSKNFHQVDDKDGFLAVCIRNRILIEIRKLSKRGEVVPLIDEVIGDHGERSHHIYAKVDANKLLTCLTKDESYMVRGAVMEGMTQEEIITGAGEEFTPRTKIKGFRLYHGALDKMYDYARRKRLRPV